MTKGKALSLVFYILSFSFLCGCQQQKLYSDKRVMLGTFVEVISPDPRAPDLAFTELQRIEGLLSKYKPDSGVSRLNQNAELKAGAELFYIVRKSLEFYAATGGAFDITVGPLVDLWGFSDKKFRQPQPEEIKKTLQLVGSDKIILNFKDNVVKFKNLGMKIDLGAIAKGYALDCAAQKLKDNKIESCLINAGGQVLCLGAKFGRPWKVAIKNPRGKEMRETLDLKDQSVSTSGDYEQYFWQGNKRLAHIIDPKTGYPANSGIISVSVIAPTGLTADALSTAIFVLGKDKGLALAKQFPGVEVKIIEERQKP